MLTIRKATLDDVNSFKLRQAELNEFWALCRMTGEEVLNLSFNSSRECRVVEQGGKMFCIFGCVPEGEGAVFWILFRDGLTELPLSFF